MVLHSLQKRQVLVTKWASHLSCYQWGQPEDWRRPATKLLVCKAARAEAFVSNTKETKTWSGWAPGCNPAISGEVCAQSTLELPSRRLKGGVVFMYLPRPSPPFCTVCASRFHTLLAPVNAIPTDSLREDGVYLGVRIHKCLYLHLDQGHSVPAA